MKPNNSTFYERWDGIKDGLHSKIYGDASAIFGDITHVYGDASGIVGCVTGMTGDMSNLRGNVAGIYGDVSNISGDVSRCYGCASRIIANVDDCDLTNFSDLVSLYFLTRNFENCFIIPIVPYLYVTMPAYPTRKQL